MNFLSSDEFLEHRSKRDITHHGRERLTTLQAAQLTMPTESYPSLLHSRTSSTTDPKSSFAMWGFSRTKSIASPRQVPHPSLEMHANPTPLTLIEVYSMVRHTFPPTLTERPKRPISDLRFTLRDPIKVHLKSQISRFSLLVRVGGPDGSGNRRKLPVGAY